MSSIARKNDDRPLDWYRVRLDTRDIERHVAKRLLLAFDSAYLDAGEPEHMHLYMASRRDGGADLYLSPGAMPAARALAHRFYAVPCTSPTHPLLLIGGGRHMPSVFGAGPAAQQTYATPDENMLSRGTSAELA